MEQNNIWDYFQNEKPESFLGAKPRLSFLANNIRKLCIPCSRVLNIGVGNGLFEEMAITLGIDVYSLDPNEKTIVALRNKFGRDEQAKIGYSQNIPFPNDYFEACVASEVLEHLTGEVLEKTLSEIHRILKPGGRFLGTVPAREKLSDNLAVCPSCNLKFHRWGHVQTFNCKNLATLLKKYFDISDIREKYFVSWSNLNWKGKMTAVLKLIFLGLGIQGSDHSLYFYAKKRFVTDRLNTVCE